MLAQVDPQEKLNGLADETLDSQEVRPVLDRDNTLAQVRARLDENKESILGGARPTYDAYQSRLAQAEKEIRKIDYIVWSLGGVAVGYAACVYVLARMKWQNTITLNVILVAFAAAGLAVRVAFTRRRRGRLLGAVPVALQAWVDDLRDGVLTPFVLQALNELSRPEALYATRLDRKVLPRLVERGEPKRLVTTDTIDRIRKISESVQSGSVGLSGPRGVGKSTIIRSLSDDSFQQPGQPELRLTMSAPVDYQPREFLIHLFIELCNAVLNSPPLYQDYQASSISWPRKIRQYQIRHRIWRSGIDAQQTDSRASMLHGSRAQLENLRFMRTITTTWSATASSAPVTLISLGGRREQQLAAQPVTMPELVSAYRKYSGEVVTWWRDQNNGSGRVVIGIDEVDKISDGQRAESFLNDIKAVFDVPGCLYLVSLSEDAMAAFARRALTIRTTFDSSFDEVVRVGPLSYDSSEQLLIKRATGLPRPFLALCHVLAGGLPRDLIRAARGLISAADVDQDMRLDEVASALVQRELDALRRSTLDSLAKRTPADLLNRLHGSDWPGTTPGQLLDAAAKLRDSTPDAGDDQVKDLGGELIVSLSFYAVVLAVFGPLHEDRLVRQLQERNFGLVDELAEARHTMKLDIGLAHSLLEQYLQRHRIEISRVPR